MGFSIAQLERSPLCSCFGLWPQEQSVPRFEFLMAGTINCFPLHIIRLYSLHHISEIISDVDNVFFKYLFFQSKRGKKILRNYILIDIRALSYLYGKLIIQNVFQFMSIDYSLHVIQRADDWNGSWSLYAQRQAVVYWSFSWKYSIHFFFFFRIEFLSHELLTVFSSSNYSYFTASTHSLCKISVTWKWWYVSIFVLISPLS